MDIKKHVKLRTIFIKYLCIFCVSTILVISAVLMIVLIIIPSLSKPQGLLPANYAQNKVLVLKDKIAKSKEVTSDIIPDLFKYAVYNNDGEKISGDLSTGVSRKAWLLLKNSENGSDFLHYYLKILRKNEVCILQYSISMEFASPILRKILPTPWIIIIVLFCIGFVLEIIILTRNFSKKFNEKMRSLQNATDKIKNQDLEFNIESSGILEIDNVLFSIDKMKEALKASMKKQWDLEQTRREQISALAHDIKTPLTIVRGNTDLLCETSQSDEQKEYTSYIMKSIYDMEQYIKTLIEISKAQIEYTINKENIDTKKYIDEIYNHINALTSIKKLKLDFKVNNLPNNFEADFNLLKRAIMNIVSNAVECSKECYKLEFIVDSTEEYIKFCVVDYGTGFSKEALRRASEQFYMGDSSRVSKHHHGMGLYITKSIVEFHNGKLKIANSEVSGGGEVTIEIPI